MHMPIVAALKAAVEPFGTAIDAFQLKSRVIDTIPDCQEGVQFSLNLTAGTEGHVIRQHMADIVRRFVVRLHT